MRSSTGLNDCKGTEIFIDDIVLNEDKLLWIIESRNESVVFKSVKFAAFYPLNKKNASNVEVIGNVLEHPHLLEDLNEH